MSQMRLDKYLADAGIGSRSQIKAFIKKGLVEINGITASKPECKITPSQDTILFQGRHIQLNEYEYFILNKPAGYVSATKDNVHPTVLSLIDSPRKDLSPVGRLDKDTEGLLLITNDGALSHMLLSPKRHVDKTYYAVIDSAITDADIDAFKQGVQIGDADLMTALPAKLMRLPASPEQTSGSFHYYNVYTNDALLNQSTTYRRTIESQYSNQPAESISHVLVTICEGKFHQVKRMFQAIGKNVLYLQRISFGNLTLPKELPIGCSRKLTEEELYTLKELVHFNDLKC